jgi:hypothetical protein
MGYGSPSIYTIIHLSIYSARCAVPARVPDPLPPPVDAQFVTTFVDKEIEEVPGISPARCQVADTQSFREFEPGWARKDHGAKVSCDIRIAKPSRLLTAWVCFVTPLDNLSLPYVEFRVWVLNCV